MAFQYLGQQENIISTKFDQQIYYKFFGNSNLISLGAVHLLHYMGKGGGQAKC